VFKRDNKDVVDNYRPISLTSMVVKTMERIIFDKISGVLHEQKLISPQQYGFRKSCSTSHLLLEVVNDWAEALEHRNSYIVVTVCS